MRTIWKYALVVSAEQHLDIPKGAKLLTVDAQDGVPCLWAQVDPEAEKVVVRLLTVGTGHEFSGWEGEYIGTYQLPAVKFVGHVYRHRLSQ